MSRTIDLFSPLQIDLLVPYFQSPFDVVPHEAAQKAAESLKLRLPDLCPRQHQFDAADGGKMFGVLVVRDVAGHTGYLSGYSGMLGGQWTNEGFVPPVFDVKERELLLCRGEREIAELTSRIQQIEADPRYHHAKVSAASYRAESEECLNAIIQQHKNNKLYRHAVRQNRTLNEEQLKELANKSRNDKAALKALKNKLQIKSRGILSPLEQFQDQLAVLKHQRKKLSLKLQRRVFEGYNIVNTERAEKPIGALFEDEMPPSGAGDCAATKLIQYANHRSLAPVALAEFWWGAAPAAALRKHGRYYPSCRSRCRKILPYMLEGVPMTVPLHERPPVFGSEVPRTLYEDEDIVVVEKPVICAWESAY